MGSKWQAGYNHIITICNTNKWKLLHTVWTHLYWKSVGQDITGPKGRNALWKHFMKSFVNKMCYLSFKVKIILLEVELLF